MYKLFFLFLLFVAVDSNRCHKDGSCRHRHNQHRPGRYNNRHFEKIFQDISWSVINMDRKYQAVCSNSSEQQIREYYGADTYTLKYFLKEYSEDNVTIKVQHRVMYLKAENNNVTVFKDIRILPRIVDAKTGQYFKQDDDLLIQFAYITNPKTENVVTCSGDINEEIQKLVKVAISEEDLRMSNS
ncbi:uncharacterized protein LOC106716051 [Papilio machaon]|uniref:uncharacterized protein LOC106716051 n=1 Tax=Papilio machaon TaxID=76193 RepID=UPI001E662FDE|nr:uncharacterized protein LOC106716051 [Papilio machaon]